MKIRADVAELLHAGYADHTIARQLHLDSRTVSAARTELGLPKAKSGPKAAATPEDLFWRRVKPTDDGHMDWDGYRNNTGAPALRHGGRLYTAYRIAFQIANGREADGYALPNCGHDGCVKPGHHVDRVIRAQEQNLDHLYNAIFGGAA